MIPVVDQVQTATRPSGDRAVDRAETKRPTERRPSGRPSGDRAETEGRPSGRPSGDRDETARPTSTYVQQLASTNNKPLPSGYVHSPVRAPALHAGTHPGQRNAGRRALRSPVAYAHLCVIAKEQITAHPSGDNFERKECIKGRLLALGFTYPVEPDGIDRALRAVTRAVARHESQTSSTVNNSSRDHYPLTRAEAAGWMVKLGSIAKSIPGVPRFTRRQADGLLVIKNIYAPAALESIARCEEYERIVTELAAAADEGKGA